MTENSRGRAKSWPYPRRARFERELRRAAAAWFAGHGFAQHTRYPFCLASREQWPRNIIDADVVRYVQNEMADREAQGKGFPLHDWIHHGLSSQAMLFNLIGPLIVRGDLTPLQAAIEEQGVPWPGGALKAVLEYEDRCVFNEDSGQPTSVDLVLADDTAPRVFVEAKLVEPEFGGCSVFRDGDCDGRNPAGDLSACYLHHIGRRYWAVLEKHGFLEGPLGADSGCALASHYQFFREVGVALENDGVFVLLSDERSPVFWCDGPLGERGLMAYLLTLLPESVRDRIARVSIQQVVSAIKSTGRHPWVAEFERKYGLAGPLA
jgi:hypothetical protein